jgi:predicted NAD/FAD-dependent oxidoreductase
MASYPQTLELSFDAAFVHGSPLAWVARNSAKPGRPTAEAWVLHASPEWSREHLELDQGTAAQRLVDAFRNAVVGELLPAASVTAHRWRFALPENPLAEACLFDEQRALVACGDWAGGPRVEGAFLSGCAAAEGLLRLYSIKGNQ